MPYTYGLSHRMLLIQATYRNGWGEGMEALHFLCVYYKRLLNYTKHHARTYLEPSLGLVHYKVYFVTVATL